MKTEILEVYAGGDHIHVDEVTDTITHLREVVYELRQNKYFTEWFVVGIDANGETKSIMINSASLHGESRFCGNY